MKLLLTSAGLCDPSLVAAAEELVGRPLSGLRAAVVPTAANVIAGDKGWLIADYVNLQRAGFAEVDIVDVSALEADVWGPRLEASDVLVLTGGDTTHLLRWLRRSGLADRLPGLLASRLLVGISAGSMVLGPDLRLSASAKPQPEDSVGLGLVDFLVLPHLGSPYFPNASEEALRVAARDLAHTVFGLADGTAVAVDGDGMTIVGAGAHVRLEPATPR
ncbi:dipeptidase E [Blastococcus sp. DSM 46786]|uniref:Type 1 glutamine amidotransferase-like domain-containing protein n=1 Tax=Blastococcus sp. DSM 46786 TaxID=1798227 RepID=UPI0008AB1755|nr:Type 1 glutamine amidotransferase-like domain-containing protein [Blastococcus sp. DSM 46786]SEL23558.1 dipeptidase E [Blastococcus sp. DSM 46786]